METRWLPCTISPGQFPTEYAVSGVQFNGKAFSLFAPKAAVRPPAVGPDGPGFVRVDVIERKGDLVLVRLPAQTFENGQFVTVRSADVETEASERVGA